MSDHNLELENERGNPSEEHTVSKRVDSIPDGRVKATIWRNEGENGPFYAVTFARTYKDDSGNLQDAHSFSGRDVLKISELSRKAYERCNELKREDLKQRRNATERPAQQPKHSRR